MKRICYCLMLFVLILSHQNMWAQSGHAKPRIIVTADPELDDLNSLIRFLLYSTDFKIEGLVYASSQFHWKGDGKGTKFMVPGREYTRYGLNLCPCESYRWKKEERFIHEAVEAYEKVYSNLIVHNKNYPTPAYLKSKIRYGNIEFEGDFSKDTEGSDLIKNVLMDDQQGPVYVTAWGGQSTIARALKSIELQYSQKKEWPAIRKKISNKLVILPSGDQDGTYASYIKPHWPDVEYRQFRSGPSYSYGAQLIPIKENAALLTADWMKTNISSRGPLGSLYRVWGDGKQMVKDDRFDYFGLQGYTNEQLRQMGYIVWMPVQPQGSWLGEGDTFTFMNFLDNGLMASNKSYPGGWAGKTMTPEFVPAVDPFSNDTSKVKDLVITDSMMNATAAKKAAEADFPSFFPAAQQDFAARMLWSVASKFADANHAPQIKLLSNSVQQVVAGKKIFLKTTVNDPDGDQFTVKWWQFSRTKSEPALIIENDHALQTSVQVPAATKEKEFYLVLEVRDHSKLPLTSYKVIKLVVQ